MAKGDDGETVAWNESESNIHEEVLRRNVKAGYCNSDGTSMGAGKGDRPRPCNNDRYRKNYEKIFKHS